MSHVLAGLLVLSAVFGAGVKLGLTLKQAEWDAAELRASRNETKVQERTGDAVAKANETGTRVVTRVRTLVKEVPVYRDAACSHDDRVFDTINGALSGDGEGRLPDEPGIAGGQIVRHNH